MAKTDNLGDFLKDVADSIRTKTGTTELINAQDFSDKILSIQTGGGGNTLKTGTTELINAQDFSDKILSIQTGGGGNTLKNLLDATKSCYYLFYNYKGISVDDLIQPNDTENVTNMYGMFYNCNKLTTIPQLNTSKVDNMNNIFASCSSLKSILMTNIGVSLDISASTLFERTDLVTILNNLKTVTTTKTLKMGATNLAKLTDEDKLIATNKGWTLA